MAEQERVNQKRALKKGEVVHKTLKGPRGGWRRRLSAVSERTQRSGHSRKTCMATVGVGYVWSGRLCISSWQSG